MARQSPCVLVVEDEGAQREVLQYNLEAEGFAVVVADNGEDALLLVQEEQPDLMVLDWMLPKVSGLEVVLQHLALCAFVLDHLDAGGLAPHLSARSAGPRPDPEPGCPWVANRRADRR